MTLIEDWLQFKDRPLDAGVNVMSTGIVEVMGAEASQQLTDLATEYQALEKHSQ